MGMRVGYARVSSSGQKLDLQMDRLADCDRIYHKKASASSAKGRPELQKALDFVRDEDVFVVTKLDRLARSVVDLAGRDFKTTTTAEVSHPAGRAIARGGPQRSWAAFKGEMGHGKKKITLGFGETIQNGLR